MKEQRQAARQLALGPRKRSTSTRSSVAGGGKNDVQSIAVILLTTKPTPVTNHAQLMEAGVIGPVGIPGVNVHHLAATGVSANKQERGQETATNHTPNMAEVTVMVLVWKSIQENVN